MSKKKKKNKAKGPPKKDAPTPRSISPHQFALLRFIFGALISLHALLISIKDFNTFSLAMLALGGAIALGVARRIASLILIVTHVAGVIFAQHSLSPLLLLPLFYLVLIPGGENFSLYSKALKSEKEWKFSIKAPVVFFAISLALHALAALPFANLTYGLNDAILGNVELWHNHGAGRSVYFRAILSIDLLVCILFFIARARAFAFMLLLSSHAAFYLSVSDLPAFILCLACHVFIFDQRWVAAKKLKGKSTIFFDGVCTLCNASVDFVIAEDRLRQFKYASLQGKLAHSRGIGSENPDSIVLANAGRFMTKSDAALTIAESLGGIWRVLAWSKVLPKRFRDRVYDWVAKNRYEVFGKESTCRVPTEKERALFLD